MTTKSFEDIIREMKRAALDNEIREHAILNMIVKCGTDIKTARRIKSCVIDKYYMAM